MSDFINEFREECKKNREYLDLTIQDISNALINVSEKEYFDFENGNKNLSKENLQRLAKILCINKPSLFDIDEYIDTTYLSKEEIEDVSKVVEFIVGVEND